MSLRALPGSIRLRWLTQAATWLGAVWYRLQGWDAALTRANLQMIFGEQWSEAQVDDLARKVFRQVAVSKLAQDIVPDLSLAEMEAFIHLEGQEHLDAALALGRGVILIGTHSSVQGYLPLMLLMRRGYPVTAVLGEEIEPDSSYVYRHLVYPVRERARHLFDIIAPGEMPQRKIVEVLRQNRILLTMGDALDEETFALAAPNVLPVRFQKHWLPLKTSPFRLARWRESPLVPFFVVPGPTGFRLVIELALPPNAADPQAEVAAFWARFEAHLPHHPEMWWHWRHERFDELVRLAEALARPVTSA